MGILYINSTSIYKNDSKFKSKNPKEYLENKLLKHSYLDFINLKTIYINK